MPLFAKSKLVMLILQQRLNIGLHVPSLFSEKPIFSFMYWNIYLAVDYK